MNTAAPFARFIPDYPALVKTLRERSEQMEISRPELDRIAGLADGYAGKVLAVDSVKRLGLQTLGPVLESLGLILVAVEDPAARDKTLARRTPFQARNRRPGNRSRKSAQEKIAHDTGAAAAI